MCSKSADRNKKNKEELEYRKNKANEDMPGKSLFSRSADTGR